ncbi:DotI/IcmL/TraM family protein (plasmid) [Methylomarinum sp. Ch1-1]|uniref:DotI/IcmL/TraM family protein n=1 Tax=Methylomarinum roseum TaxID=3067653 RepID=A0AAU7P1M4_9GAMM|nr:DotI/IcmL/TraM family protein [Methylomarinum sp. Ch1-1]MDP4523179.1 DotI/IcmL/TraM family protein [Methylomarinum sp. Ch1-1]
MNSNEENIDQNIGNIINSEFDGLTTVMNSLNWYKRQYFKVSKILMIIIICLLLSITGNAIQFMHEVKPVYFAQKEDMTITPLIPLNQPYLNNESVINWFSQVVIETLSLDHIHYKNDLMKVRRRYSDSAFYDLVKSMKAQGVIDMIDKQGLSTKVKLTKSPTILASGEDDDGVFTWKLSLSLSIKYHSSKAMTNSQDLNATALIKRGNIINNPDGVFVNQIVFSYE